MSSLRHPLELLVLILLVLPGCGGGPEGPETAPVTGVVTLNGRPLEGADVLFQPVEAGPGALACQAVTDAQGRFTMSTHVGGGTYKPGMVPGEYGVSITKLDLSRVQSTFTPPENLLPEKYASPRTSGFTATVSADQDNHFEFPLQGKD